MKRVTSWSLAGLCLVATLGPAHAQLRVSIDRPHAAVLHYERAPVTVRVFNDTEVDVNFGRYAPEAVLHVRMEQRRYEGKVAIADRPPVMNSVIPSGTAMTYTIDLRTYFDTVAEGRQTVSAYVEWMGRHYPAGSVSFDVVRGIELLTVEKSLPYDPTEVRQYSLRYWQRDDSQNLFLVVSSEDRGLVYGVFDLGRIVRTQVPSIQFDRIGRVHVTHLYGRDVLSHTYLLSDGTGVWLWRHKYTDSAGRLLAPEQDFGGESARTAVTPGEAARADEPTAAEPAAAATPEPAEDAAGAERPRSRFLFQRLWPFGGDD